MLIMIMCSPSHKVTFATKICKQDLTEKEHYINHCCSEYHYTFDCASKYGKHTHSHTHKVRNTVTEYNGLKNVFIAK